MSRLLWFALLFSLITLDQTEGWRRRRRRRRRCSRVDCAVTWRSWSSCSRSCGGGTKYRLGSVARQPACGGSPCPALRQSETCNSQSCPVHGGWSSWSGWGSCSRNCGTGNQYRYRSCTAPSPKYGGRSCIGSSTQRKSCFTKHCPVHGGWSSWGAWGSCSRTCGTGNQYRYRSCTAPSPKYGGRSCIGSSTQRKSCFIKHCPVHGGWSSWGGWSSCSRACGIGFLKRYRSCTSPAPAHGGRSCTGASSQGKSCIKRYCPVHGSWSGWGGWGSCSRTCGSGVLHRYRKCNAPAPAHGGRSCTGSSSQSMSCTLRPCPVNGSWSSWSGWNSCNRPCGTGSQQRSRSCTNPPPLYGGKACSGTVRGERSCNQHPCPVNGGWSSWSGWNSCNRPCGTGSQERFRSCTNPPPLYGGKACSGTVRGERSCNQHPCPVNGGWSSWSGWNSCNMPCGTGSQERFRSCTNPPPLYGGKACSGTVREKRTCNRHPCPVDGGWSNWGAWTTCSKPCESGTQVQLRTCSQPSPQYGGKKCPGAGRFERVCNTHSCPVNGGWSSWFVSTPCNVTCGSGKEELNRTCTNPEPKHGGNPCNGVSRKEQNCTRKPCPIHGGWSGWSLWRPCSVTCGSGEVILLRNCTNPAPQHGGDSCKGLPVKSHVCKKDHCPVDGGWSQWSEWTDCNVTCGNGVMSRKRNCDNPAPIAGGRLCDGPSKYVKSCNASKTCFNEVGCYGKFPRSSFLRGFKSEIQWSESPLYKQMEKVIEKCALVATDEGMKFFALEDFGNCYGAEEFPAGSQTGALACNLGVGFENFFFVYKALM